MHEAWNLSDKRRIVLMIDVADPEGEYNGEQNDIAPQRDLREPQPTISVNYRVIKNNGENELKNINQSIKDSKYDDDWNNNDSEW